MPPRAYLTITPWVGFTPRERKRDAPLARCPSAACRRAKACVDAHDKLYCQRSHQSLTESRAGKILEDFPRMPKNPNARQVEAHRIILDLQLEEAETAKAVMTQRWKAGELDALYGAFKPGGIWKYPPLRQYTE
jgi:hypothetical protein